MLALSAPLLNRPGTRTFPTLPAAAPIPLPLQSPSPTATIQSGISWSLVRRKQGEREATSAAEPGRAPAPALTSFAEDAVDAVFRLLLALLRFFPLQLSIFFFSFPKFASQNAADGAHFGKREEERERSEAGAGRRRRQQPRRARVGTERRARIHSGGPAKLHLQYPKGLGKCHGRRISRRRLCRPTVPKYRGGGVPYPPPPQPCSRQAYFGRLAIVRTLPSR